MTKCKIRNVRVEQHNQCIRNYDKLNICREGTEDTKFKLTKKKKFESKSHPWIPTPEMKTIREFIEKIQDDYPEASIEIVPLSCEEGKMGY